jgi:hypothetical protein
MSASIWNPGATTQAATGNGTITENQTLVLGQTLVILATYTYTPGAKALFVYLNGVLQQIGTAYTETSSSSITFTEPAAEGTICELVGIVNLVNLNTGLFDASEIDLASAATADIGGTGTNLVRLTGNVTINSFGINFRGPIFIRTTSTLTITSGAALITPGNVNLLTVAGGTYIASPKATSGVEDGWVISDLNASLFQPAGTGAVATTVQAKLRESVSVLDFGASTLAAGAVNAAAFSAAWTASNPRAVLVPAGTYLFTGSVTGKFYSFGAVVISGGTVTSVTNLVP